MLSKRGPSVRGCRKLVVNSKKKKKKKKRKEKKKKEKKRKKIDRNLKKKKKKKIKRVSFGESESEKGLMGESELKKVEKGCHSVHASPSPTF